MKMLRFRVQNYKNINDSNWVEVSNPTVFVGKNESGKSAIFRGLSKLNPSDGQKYDALKEFPRSRYTSEFKRKDWPVSSAVFELADEEIEEIIKIDMHNEIEKGLIRNITDHIMTNFNEDWQMDVFKEIIVDIDRTKKYFKTKDQLKQAKEWAEEKFPKFVYFDEYGIIDSAIYIPEFITELKEKPSDPLVRSKKCLFEHVGLDVEIIQKLDPLNKKKTVEELRRIADERAILMTSASRKMTETFSEWWEQRKHEFRYQIEGPHFRIWVWDDIDPSEIELDQRSRGMQYFFSFYLVFLVESEYMHKNAILLLDEPGLHVHAGAQQKIVEFLETLSEKNQLLYTTHSPFMINGDKLENVRITYEDKKEKTAKVSQDVWPKDKEALFPLQAALGYAIAQTLFYAKRQLVVEGLTDYSILKAINEHLSEREMISLRDDTIIVPAGGTRNLLPLASMLIGHDIKIAVLLDGDAAGRSKGKDLNKKLMVKYLMVSDFNETKEAEIEDLFPEDLYIEAVREAYSDIDLPQPLEFTEEEKEIICIAKRIKHLFVKLGIEKFEKWRPGRVLNDWIRTRPDEILDDDIRKKFENIFKEVNKILR